MTAAQALAILMRPAPATPGITDPLTGPRPTWRWQGEATPDYDATVAQLGDPHTVDAIPEPEPLIDEARQVTA